VFVTAAALGDPAVVIADGPNNGFDARGRAVLAELFKAWGKDRVVLFASYDEELVEGGRGPMMLGRPASCRGRPLKSPTKRRRRLTVDILGYCVTGLTATNFNDVRRVRNA